MFADKDREFIGIGASSKVGEAARRTTGEMSVKNADRDNQSEENVSEGAVRATVEKNVETGACGPRCGSGGQVKCQHR